MFIMRVSGQAFRGCGSIRALKAFAFDWAHKNGIDIKNIDFCTLTELSGMMASWDYGEVDMYNVEGLKTKKLLILPQKENIK